MPRFLAIHPLPAKDWKTHLGRLAEHAAAAGIRPVETFYAEGRAYTLYDAPDPGSIRALHGDADVPAPTDVLAGEQVFTELLAEHRAR